MDRIRTKINFFSYSFNCSLSSSHFVFIALIIYTVFGGKLRGGKKGKNKSLPLFILSRNKGEEWLFVGFIWFDFHPKISWNRNKICSHESKMTCVLFCDNILWCSAPSPNRPLLYLSCGISKPLYCQFHSSFLYCLLEIACQTIMRYWSNKFFL